MECRIEGYKTRELSNPTIKKTQSKKTNTTLKVALTRTRADASHASSQAFKTPFQSTPFSIGMLSCCCIVDDATWFPSRAPTWGDTGGTIKILARAFGSPLEVSFCTADRKACLADWRSNIFRCVVRCRKDSSEKLKDTGEMYASWVKPRRWPT